MTADGRRILGPDGRRYLRDDGSHDICESCCGFDCIVGGASSTTWDGTDGENANVWLLRSNGTVGRYHYAEYGANAFAIDPDGGYWIVGNRVCKYDKDGNLLWTWNPGYQCKSCAAVGYTLVVAALSQNNSWDGSNGNYACVWTLDEDGNVISYWGHPDTSGGYNPQIQAVATNGEKIWIGGWMKAPLPPLNRDGNSVLQFPFDLSSPEWNWYCGTGPGMLEGWIGGWYYVRTLATDGVYCYVGSSPSKNWQLTQAPSYYLNSSMRNIWKLNQSGVPVQSGYYGECLANTTRESLAIFSLKVSTLGTSATLRFDMGLGDRGWICASGQGNFVWDSNSLKVDQTVNAWNSGTNACIFQIDSTPLYQYIAGYKTDQWQGTDGTMANVWKRSWQSSPPVWTWCSGAYGLQAVKSFSNVG